MDGESKRRVFFKDTNDDDLLADLLLEDEDFPEDKKDSNVSNTKSNLMEDLFKIKPSVTTDIKLDRKLNSNLAANMEVSNQIIMEKQSRTSLTSKGDDSTLLQNVPSSERNVRKVKNIFNDDEDILSHIIDKSQGISDKSRASLSMKDLFEDKSQSFLATDFINQKKVPGIEMQDSNHSLEVANTMQPQRSQVLTDTAKPPAARQPRRLRRNSKLMNDPLGLLTDDTLGMVSESGGEKGNKKLPEWLDGTKTLENKKSGENKELSALSSDSTDKLEKKINSTENINSYDATGQTKTTISHGTNVDTVYSYPENLSSFIGTQLDQQAALMVMQQQEHELRAANVLSQENVQLSKVLDVRQSRFNKQEEQFNALVRTQLEKQVLLEKQIKLQQERIDRYIQVLMTQPVSLPISSASCPTINADDGYTETTAEGQEIKNLVQKLQLDKLELENTFQMLNKKHENEIMIQEECYRQISFLQDAMENLRNKTKQEMEYLEADYMAKFEKLRNEKIEVENIYKEEISNMKKEHAGYIEDMCKQHTQNISILQKEHSEIIKNISKSKREENQAIEVMTTHKSDIDSLLQKTQTMIESLKENQEKVELRDNNIITQRENYLKMQEDDIKVQKLELAKQKETMEKHFNTFFDTTEKLDSRLTQLVTELQKQSVHCSQTQELLEKRMASFLRDKELFEEKVKWERDYLQTLKDSWTKEQERQLKSLKEEKEIVASKRAQLQIASMINTGASDVTKMELETAIKTAQEATARANQERLKWQKKLLDLEVQQQVIRDEENALILRAKELENLTQSALVKREEGVKALKSAKHLQDQHNEKLRQVQTHLEGLIQREKKVATEKFNVARGRLISRTSEAEKLDRDADITVARIYSDVQLYSPNFQPTSEITTRFMEVVDPDLLMLKLDLDDQLDTTTKYLQVFDNNS